MFQKECDKFRDNVVKTMWSFFKMKPEEIKDSIDKIFKEYGDMYNLDTVDYRYVRPELKEVVMRYRTMKYFYDIYVKLDELKIYLDEGVDNGYQGI